MEYEEAYFFKEKEDALEEAVDVIISSIGALRYPYIWVLIAKKMKKNKKRLWENGHHVA